jgi:hypothetical protein
MKKRRLLAILVAVAMVASFMTMFTSTASGEAGGFSRLWGGQDTYTYDVTLRLTFGATVAIAAGDTLTLKPSTGGGPFGWGDNIVRLDESVVSGRMSEDNFGVRGVGVASPFGGSRGTVTRAGNFGDPDANEALRIAGFKVVDACENDLHIKETVIDDTACVGKRCWVSLDEYKLTAVTAITPATGQFREGSYTHIDVVVRGVFYNANRAGAELKGDWTIEDFEIVPTMRIVLDRTPLIAAPEVFTFSASGTNRISIQSVRANDTKASAGETGNLRNVSGAWYGEHKPEYGGNEYEVGMVWGGAFRTPTHLEAPFIFGMTGASMVVELQDALATQESRAGSFNAMSAEGDDAAQMIPAADVRRLVVWTDLVMNGDGNPLTLDCFVEMSQSDGNRALTNASVTNVPSGNNVRRVNVTNLTQDMFWNEEYDPDLDIDDPLYKPQFATRVYVALITRSGGFFEDATDVMRLHKLELNVVGNEVLIDLPAGPGAAVLEFGGIVEYEYEIDLTVNFGEQIRFPAAEDGVNCDAPARALLLHPVIAVDCATCDSDALIAPTVIAAVGTCADGGCTVHTLNSTTITSDCEFDCATNTVNCATAPCPSHANAAVNEAARAAFVSACILGGHGSPCAFEAGSGAKVDFIVGDNTIAHGGQVLSVFNERRGETVDFNVTGLAINGGQERTDLGNISRQWLVVESMTPGATELSEAKETRTPALATDGYGRLTITLSGFFGKGINDTVARMKGDWAISDIELAQGLQLVLDGTTSFADGHPSRTGTFRNLGTTRQFTVSRVESTGEKRVAPQGNGVQERGYVFYEGSEGESSLKTTVSENTALLDIGVWAWNKAPYVMNAFDTASLAITFMEGVNPNAGGNRFVGNPGTTNAATASNSNRILMWTDLIRNDNNDVMTAFELLGTAPDEVEARSKVAITVAPNNRIATAQAVATFDNIPASFFYNEDYDENIDENDPNYIPEFASEIYILITCNRFTDERETILNAGGLIRQLQTDNTGAVTKAGNSVLSQNAIITINEDNGGGSGVDMEVGAKSNGIFASTLTINGLIEGDIPTVTYIIDDVTDYLVDGKLDLVALMAEKGADYIQLSEKALEGIADDGDDIVVIFDKDGSSYTIIADSIEDAAAFILNVTVSADAVEGYKLGEGSIVITFVQEGDFGFDVVFTFSEDDVEDFDIDALNLWYVKGNTVTPMPEAIEIVFCEEDEDCVEYVLVTISSASFYVLGDTTPEGDGTPPVTGTTAQVTVATPGTGTTAPVTGPVGPCPDCGHEECECPDVTTPVDTSVTEPQTSPADVDTTAVVTTPAPDDRKVGDVNGDEKLTILDALEILMNLAGMPSELDNPAGAKAAMIVSTEKAGINDALEILIYLAGMDSVLTTTWPRA